MFSEKTQGAFNDQLNMEFYSSYLYLSMSAYFESQHLTGMASWMRIQAQEEHGHAMKFFDYILGRNGKVVLGELRAPQTEWSSVLEAFEDAYRHECRVTGRLNDLTTLSVGEKDHAANVFLQWFVSEQVEEEATVLDIVEKLRLVKDNSAALFMMDQELGKRTPSPQSPQGDAV
jgi:ferritin